jgi:two-component system, response regulator PdtaR
MNPPDTSRPPQLMLVDDDRLVISTLSLGLQQAGYLISSAESAEEAETLLASGERPDLAIVDIRMSGQNGLYLAKRLHELDHIPFIIFSAYSDEAMIEQANRSGALGYLVKPLDIVQLVPAIESALARANELQELRATRMQLQAALDGERDISIAVGITMSQHRLKRQEAFELLRKSARSRRSKLVDLAREIIQAGEGFKY